MGAAVIAAGGRARLEQVQLPEPGPGQVRIRIEGSGVCGSNLPVWEGRPWFQYPLQPGAPGHEGWGVVDAVGEGVSGLAPGQRVTMLSSHAYAEFDLADAAQVLPLPAALDGMPFPGEALGCAFNIFRRSEIAAGQDVAIIGIGFLGALLTRLAADAGARVIGISRRPFSLDVARHFGAAETIQMTQASDVVDRVMSLAGDGCHRVIEAVGLQEPLDLAARLTRVRGRLVIAGYHQDGTRQVDMQLWNWRGLDVVNAHERAPEVYVEGIRAAIEAVSSGRLDPRPLYTHSFGIGQLGSALDAMRDRPDGFMKALVTN
jgi:threonine dehydrogenase-like Zn-dependent dehydrogenase